MRRIWVYLGVVVVAGIAAAIWFVATEEVDPAATEPGAYGLFLRITVAAAVVAAVAMCALCEGLFRAFRRRRTVRGSLT